jgi:hypothetical protein
VGKVLDVDMVSIFMRAGQASSVKSTVQVDDEQGKLVRRRYEDGGELVQQRHMAA